MKALREAAAQMLASARAGAQNVGAASDAGPLRIERLTCEVQGPRRTELVSLRVEDGRVQVICTCAQPGCVHVRAVLQLIAPELAVPAAAPPAQELALGLAVESRALAAMPPPAAAALLGEALADLVTAVARAGVCSDRVASVLESLARVERALPKPLPLGLLRWLGCMREAIDAQDTARAAQALSAAAQLSQQLRGARTQNQDDEAQLRLSCWFGGEAAGQVQRLSDRSLVEVAREWVDGTTRHQIERRYLVDLDSGECFREECVRGEGMSSVGPCPRLIGVSLAEVDAGCSPRRLRLLQYTTTPAIERTHWDNLAAWGQRDSEALGVSYRRVVSEFGALAEPFVIAAPRSLSPESRPSLAFDRGAPLPLFADDDPGVLKRCAQLAGAANPRWVAGRLLQFDGQLMLRPLAMGIVEAALVRFERL